MNSTIRHQESELGVSQIRLGGLEASPPEQHINQIDYENVSDDQEEDGYVESFVGISEIASRLQKHTEIQQDSDEELADLPYDEDLLDQILKPIIEYENRGSIKDFLTRDPWPSPAEIPYLMGLSVALKEKIRKTKDINEFKPHIMYESGDSFADYQMKSVIKSTMDREARASGQSNTSGELGLREGSSYPIQDENIGEVY